MVKISEELKEIIRDNISYFATSSKDGKPNVVPVGLVKAISDTELIIVDIFFRKTRKNLEENPQVSLAVTDMGRLKAYQLKGEAEIITQGELFNMAFDVMREKAEIRKKKLQQFAELAEKNRELERKLQIMRNIHERMKPKAVILMKVKEIYSTIPWEKYSEE